MSDRGMTVNFTPPGPPNLGPVWDDVPTQELTVGVPFTLTLHDFCHDPEGNVLSFIQTSGTPITGTSFNDPLDQVSGTPAAIGNTTMTFRASDGNTTADKTITFNCLNADVTPPPAPASLTATAVSNNQIDLAWTAVTDPVVANARTTGLAGYRLFRNGLFLKNVPSTQLTYSDTGLPPNATYRYNVKGYDGNNNPSEPWSADAFATTLASRKDIHGHYSFPLKNNRSQSNMQAMIEPATRGFFKRYEWKQFETSLGVYNFTELLSDLNWAQTQGMRFVPFVEHKTFKTFASCVPAYLDAYTLTATDGDVHAAIWAPYVITRYLALMQAIATNFNSHPAFWGVSSMETAMGGFTDAECGTDADGQVPAGKLYPPYSPAAFRDAWIQILQSCATIFPSTRFWFGSNFIRDNNSGSILAEIINATKSLNSYVMWGPDCLPNNSSLLTRFYPYFDQFQNDVPLAIHAQPDSYNHTKPGGGFYNMSEIFLYGRDELHVNAFIWTYIPNPKEPGAYDYDDARPIMNQYPNFNLEAW
jgi:hypothetical protein